VSKVNARRSLILKLKSMRNSRNSFRSSTGKQMYFNAFQDVPPVYELVNLNVRELLLVFNLTHISASYKSMKTRLTWHFVYYKVLKIY